MPRTFFLVTVIFCSSVERIVPLDVIIINVRVRVHAFLPQILGFDRFKRWRSFCNSLTPQKEHDNLTVLFLSFFFSVLLLLGFFFSLCGFSWCENASLSLFLIPNLGKTDPRLLFTWVGGARFVAVLSVSRSAATGDSAGSIGTSQRDAFRRSWAGCPEEDSLPPFHTRPFSTFLFSLSLPLSSVALLSLSDFVFSLEFC